uniref:Uncharacterized protein n=1 Tax=Pipistrellus kuhlii TaxID=59472 RepID=A0A7J7SFM7_PIPKU|nr:hypothetical protein mPipKuh1_009960 [Pipistrellus kuhlii]
MLVDEKENLEEEQDNLRNQIETLTNRNRKLLTENEDQAWLIEKVNLPTVKVEEEEETIVDSFESQAPVHKKKKRWMRARAIVKFFKRKNSDLRKPGKTTPDCPPEPVEATPSCSTWAEERVTLSAPVGKAVPPKKNKKKKEDKSPAARPALLKRLQFWSSLDTPPPSK